MMERGMIALGKADFFMSARSNTMLGVTLLSESEKKFQTNKPAKRK